jgi:hypothetical protein
MTSATAASRPYLTSPDACIPPNSCCADGSSALTQVNASRPRPGFERSGFRPRELPAQYA